MATNLKIDEKLLHQAQKLGGLKTKKATVNIALKEFVARRQQASLMKLFNSLKWNDDYDYKSERSRNT